MRNWIKTLEGIGACSEALAWGEQFTTPDEAWAACERGDWMLWLLGKLAGGPETASRKKLVLAACQCARFALPYVKEGETRPLKAIKFAEAWAKGASGVSLQDVNNAAAADAAYAAYAAAAAAYAYAAADAAYAAFAAAAAADAAYAYAYAAAAAADAAYAYAAAAAADRGSILKKCADVVRSYYDTPTSKEKPNRKEAA